VTAVYRGHPAIIVIDGSAGTAGSAGESAAALDSTTCRVLVSVAL
jgi:hypothetical protein